MATVNREMLLRKPYKDLKNYPYGFSRSGDFSIRESNALLQYGSLISALLAGEIKPEIEEDKNLLAVAKGEKEAETLVEKSWVKYQKRINRPKVGSVYGRGKIIADDGDYDSSEDDVLDDD